ncbi:hypothetical protein [Mucilaginibacter sp. dw_454]|uniref:hypothetical protein n=1 Tax=Mucilaginibacter sp. dw_454 TaxID=2720079 RepID=UPI001BD63A4B|nr:hypothetical protein [Mucilaginibacter sp. dw_454]
MSKERLIFLAALIVYVVYAVFNNGFYYYDEHYQLIEFAELKSGNNLPSDLTWEYAFKIRSALQPAIAYWFFSLCRAFNINNHYTLITLLRVATSVIALSIVTYFINQTSFLIQDRLKIWYRLLACFLWFLPFINVRFSSESYAGLAFMLSIAVFYSPLKQKAYLMGLLFGLSFLFRFQTAFLSAGFFCWLIFINKANFKFLLKLAAAGVFMLAVGFLVDTWFYGVPVFTFYNYYIANVIHDAASGWGVSPWYFYFTESLQTLNAAMALLIWVCLLFQFIFNRRGLICWAVVPFLLVHCLTPHKELRFLFPMANLIPLFIMLTVQTVIAWRIPKPLRYTLAITTILILAINVLSIFAVAFSPADSEGRMTLTKYIHDHYPDKKVQLLVFGWDNPYRPIPEKQNFYLDKNVQWKQCDLSAISDSNKGTKNLIIVRDSNLSLCQPFLQFLTIGRLKSGIPAWVKIINNFLGFRNGSLTLYEIKAVNSTGT